MHFPIKRWIDQGNQTHGLKPARPGRFEMDSSFCQLPHMGEDGKFITSGMDGEFIVPIILGNEHMLIEMSAKCVDVSAVIHPLLELTGESGCKGIDVDPPVD